MISIVRLFGCLHVLEEPLMGADAAGADPEIRTLVTRPSDERPPALSSEDLARLGAGCVRLALSGTDDRPLAQMWVRVGHQYPAILDMALRLEPRTAYVFGLFVEPGARRRGLGRKATALAEREARASGAQAILGWIERANRPSMHLFMSLGYRRIVNGLRITWGNRVLFWCWRLAPAARPYVDRASRRV